MKLPITPALTLSLDSGFHQYDSPGGGDEGWHVRRILRTSSYYCQYTLHQVLRVDLERWIPDSYLAGIMGSASDAYMQSVILTPDGGGIFNEVRTINNLEFFFRDLQTLKDLFYLDDGCEFVEGVLQAGRIIFGEWWGS